MLALARWLLFLLLGFSCLGFAEDLQLFDQNHHRVQGYDYLIRRLRTNDVVGFSDGKTFVVDRILGNGGTTLILGLKGDPTKALRIPLNFEGMGYLEQFIYGDKYILKQGIPAVKIYESFDDQYAVVDRLYNFMTFKDFVSAATRIESPGVLQKLGIISSSSLPIDEMKKNFLDFANSIAFSENIGDLHDANLVYDFQSKKWLLIDWTGDSHDARYKIMSRVYFESITPLKSLLKYYGKTSGLQFQASDKKHRWLQDMIDQANEVIQQKRERELRGVRSCSGIFL